MAAPRPSPEHRPPSILSEFGEGYCRWCFFVVGLDAAGMLDAHSRSASMYDASREICDGSGTKPPKITPYASRKAAFKVKTPDAWCPECKQFVHTTTQGGMQVYARHSHPVVVPRTVPRMCAYVSRRVERDHGRERG